MADDKHTRTSRSLKHAKVATRANFASTGAASACGQRWLKCVLTRESGCGNDFKAAPPPPPPNPIGRERAALRDSERKCDAASVRCQKCSGRAFSLSLSLSAPSLQSRLSLGARSLRIGPLCATQSAALQIIRSRCRRRRLERRQRRAERQQQPGGPFTTTTTATRKRANVSKVATKLCVDGAHVAR